MSIDFEPYLVGLMILSAIFALFDLLILAPKRKKAVLRVLGELGILPAQAPKSLYQRTFRALKTYFLGQLDDYPALNLAADQLDSEVQKKCFALLKPRAIFDYARSLFPIFLLVVIIRSFLFEPYMVPTGSLMPTVLPGDFLVVNKFAYGLKLPLSRDTFYSTGEPERGDIVVFKYPPNPSINYVKRLIGLPGDHLTYKDKVLYVNGIQSTQTTEDKRAFGLYGNSSVEKQEDLLGVKHDILIDLNHPPMDFTDLVVPQDFYFMMGDNRDNSLDSRFWGFVPKRNLVGRAEYIWLSKIPNTWTFRWSRIGIPLEVQ